MRVGLLLGGGGAVGIAWESGVVAGLADACGFDPLSCTVIVGTSAGSAVGAELALGRDPHHALARDEELRPPSLEVPDLTQGPFAEILELMLSGEARTTEGAQRMGRLAIQAETSMAEHEFVALFRRSAGTDGWPDAVDFRATTTRCDTGQPRVWTAADGIELSRAVASSCAIPGFFPTVSFEGRRHMDANRGKNYHTKIVADLDLDAAGLNLMDSSQRSLGFEIGHADGLENAPAIAALLN